MILLDTNWLIRMLVTNSYEAEALRRLVQEDADLCTTVIAWYEFLSGPVNPEAVLFVQGIIDDRILPWTQSHAQLSAELWNATGRKRHLRIDAMIAAAAITANAELATSNTTDFEVFTKHGLRLAKL